MNLAFLSRASTLLVIIIVAACSRTPLSPEPALDVAGKYILDGAWMNGMNGSPQPLPVVYSYDATYDTRRDIIAGQLELRGDSTWTQSLTVKYVQGTLGGRVAPGEEGQVTSQGRYSVRGDSVLVSKEVNGEWQRLWSSVATDNTVVLILPITRPGLFRRVP